jgi:hypothetical protein
MLTDGELPADFWDWRYGADFDFRETRDDEARAQAIEDAKAPRKDGAVAAADANPPQAAATHAKTSARAGADGLQATAANSNALTARAAGGKVQQTAVANVDAFAHASTALQAPATDDKDKVASVASAAGSHAMSAHAHEPLPLQHAHEHAAEVAKAQNTKGIEVTGVHLKLPRAFTSTHDIHSMNVTNHVPDFSGVLDYIWCEKDRVRVTVAHRVPSPDEVGGYLPNEKHPSDHLPVVADIELERLSGESPTALKNHAASGLTDRKQARMNSPKHDAAASTSGTRQRVQVLYRSLADCRIARVNNRCEMPKNSQGLSGLFPHHKLTQVAQYLAKYHYCCRDESSTP